MANKNFKVIVIGGGPVGVTMANSLAKAGIDFVVLERRLSIGEDEGASLFLAAEGLRALAQLGILDRLYEISAELIQTRITTNDGRLLKETRLLDNFRNANGTNTHVFHRAHLVRAVYDNLSESDKSRVLTNKKVIDIAADDLGVTVRCADGSKYDGSIVVGADGTHSLVRKRMRTLALQASPTIDIGDEKPFSSSYRTMWCSFPFQGFENGGPPGTAWAAHGWGHSLQYAIGHDGAWIFIYEKLPAETKETPRYTEKDTIAFAEKWADLAVGDTLTVKDVFPQRHRSGMITLEEGIAKRWSWGRIVLAGDAVHKFTPNIGLGYINGLQDAFALTNELYRVLHAPSQEGYKEKTDKARSKKDPGIKALSTAFERYQNSRVENVKSDWTSSAMETRLAAWHNNKYWFMDRWVRPYTPRWFDMLLARRTGMERASRGVVLDFLDGEEPFPTARVAWKNPIPGLGGLAAVKEAERSSTPSYWRILGVCCVFIAAYVVLSRR
ncbi:FAD/NAD(P)-binding domain-containing protein [Jackrogersella minutella]|nr:FAD/NAD(P)-binding domain-containing protein [Jackrogersella minutella]